MDENKESNQTCDNCNKKYHESDYALLCRGIMKHKPACSYECNKALKQTNQ